MGLQQKTWTNETSGLDQGYSLGDYYGVLSILSRVILCINGLISVMELVGILGYHIRIKYHVTQTSIVHNQVSVIK